jgi:hypothetical protein
MKKYFILFLFFISVLGYAQNPPELQDDGSRTYTITNPALIVVTKIPETNSTVVKPTDSNPANGKIEFSISGGIKFASGNPYTVSLIKGTTEILNTTNYSFEFVSPNKYKCTVTGLDEGTYKASIIDDSCPTPITETFTLTKPLPIQVTVQPFNIKCFGDKGTLTANPVTGGIPFTGVTNYNFEWFKKNADNSFSTIYQYTAAANNLEPATYKVIITDSKGNSSESSEVAVTQNPKITVSATPTPALCYGDKGSISLAISNGTTPYTIVWTGANRSTAILTNTSTLLTGKGGVYNYSITDNLGCKFSTNPIDEEIEEPENPFSISLKQITHPSPIIDNGTIDIEVNDGYGNYSYSWYKNGFLFTPTNNVSLSGLGNGTYSVTITDKNKVTDLIGCTKTIDNIILKSLSATINILNPINCIGDTTTLEAMPIGGRRSYTYQWFKGTDTNAIGTNKTLANCDATDYKVIVNDGIYTFSVNQTLKNPTNPPISIVTSNTTAVNCNGGSDGTAHIEVKDGTPVNGIYTFIWNKAGILSNTNSTSTISGLSAGTYTVTVKDKYCSKDFPVVVTQPTKPITIPTESITPVLIYGQNTGAITFALDPTGGNTGGYTYNWTSSTDPTFIPKNTKDISGLKAGFYTLEIKDSKQCPVSKPFEVTQSPELLVSIKESSPIKCNGDFNGELQADISGGLGTKTFQWFKDGSLIAGNSFKLTGMGFGDYKVTVTDFVGAIKTSVLFPLKQPVLLTVASISQTNVLCHGEKTGAIPITIEGGTIPYKSIVWSKVGDPAFVANDALNPTALGYGNYQIVVTDAHDCVATLSENVTISQPEFPLEIKAPTVETPQITNLTGYDTKNGKIAVTITGGTPAYTYAWYSGFKKDWTPTATAIPAQTNATIDKLDAGDYYVRVTDKNKICVVVQDFTIKQPEKLEIKSISQTGNTDILCFGNETAEFNATFTGGVAPYTFVWKNKSTGKVYTSTQTTTDAITMATASNLGAGDYEITVTDLYSNTLYGNNTFSVSQPNKLVFTYKKTDVTCKGSSSGSIQLAITGGTVQNDINNKPIYKISCDSNTLSTVIDIPNQKITGLAAGKWHVIVSDDNSCVIATQEIEIKESDSALAFDEESITNTTGNGISDGSIKLKIVGGWKNYSYKWHTGNDAIEANQIANEFAALLSNKPAGFYTVEVTDTNINSLGCPIVKSFEIKQPKAIQLEVKATNATCNGSKGALLATAAEGFPYSEFAINRIYSYKLYKKPDLNTVIQSQIGNTAYFIELNIGDYTVIATDEKNNTSTANTKYVDGKGITQGTNFVSLTQPDPIVVKLESKSEVLCFGENQGAITISATGGTPFTTGATYNYVWKRDGVDVGINSDTQALLYAGTYTVEVQDANYDSSNPASCVGISNPIVLVAPLDLNFNYNKLSNSKPTSNTVTDGSIHIEMIGGKSQYTYRCTRGTENGPEVFLKTTTDLAVDILNLSKDHYFITVTDNTGCPKKIDFDFNSTTNLTVSLQTPIAIVCKNGNTTLNSVATGGIGQNQYSWFKNGVKIEGATNTTLTNAGAGKYYVVIINADKKEETSNEITVTEPLQVEFTTVQETVKCKDDNTGSITATAVGGNGSFQYRYTFKSIRTAFTPFTNGNTTTISRLLAGEYTIEVNDTNSCTSTSKKVTITQPAEAVTIAATTKTPTLRFGSNEGSISITPQGGNGGYTYEWFRKDNSKINQTTSTATSLFAGWYYVVVKDIKLCTVTSNFIEVIQPPLLVANVAIQNSILCQGNTTASIKATATGGFLKPGENYTYKWFAYGTLQPVLGTNQILENLKAGDSYYVLATDSNAINAASGKITITEPTALDNYLTADYTLCGDGKDWTILANPSEGTPLYSYIWNTGATTPSISDATAGTYNVMVTDKNGCTITKNITITIPAHLATAETITKPTCFDGSDATIVLTSSGGRAPYTYLWNTGEKSNVLSNASAKEYSVAVTDFKGCVINKTYAIENPPKDVINLGEDVTLCFDQSLTINATIDDDKAKYSWTSTKGFTSNKPIITVSEPAEYTLVVTNRLGCNATDMLKISKQDTAISAEFAASSQVFMNEKFIIVDISNPIADSIEWILPLEATVVSKNKDFAELSFSKAGEYELTLNTKKGNCTATQTKKIVVVEGEYTDPDSTDLKKKFDLKTYPNPSNGIFTVDVTLDKVMSAHIKVYSLTNNVIIDSKYEEGKDNYSFNFSLSGLTAGVYFVLVESQQGNQLRKIIIN